MKRVNPFRRQILIQTVRNLIKINSQVQLGNIIDSLQTQKTLSKEQLEEFVFLGKRVNPLSLALFSSLSPEETSALEKRALMINQLENSKGPFAAIFKEYSFVRYRRLSMMLFFCCVAGFLFVGHYIYTSWKMKPSESLGVLDVMATLRQKVGIKVAHEAITTRFKDVIGCDEAINELQDVCDFLKNPAKYLDKGIYLPKGILLSGPPGTGKTLLARALAGETGAAFFTCSGSEFEQSIVGLGAKRIRTLFEQARANAPAIIFIDEIDAIGAKRSATSHSVYRQAINQILTEMDGFDSSAKILVLGATNFAESLDPALMRSGRFDKTISISAPDLNGRRKLFKYYLSKVKHSRFLDVESFAKRTIRMTGADIKNLVNIAALKAVKASKSNITDEDMDYAYDRVQMGVRSAMGTKDFSEYEKRAIAIHETGHALVALLTDGMTDVHKVTILPAGGSLGHTALIPKEESLSYTKDNLLKQIDSMLGGRVAEEMFLGKDKITTGCGDDLRKATQSLYSYIRDLGMEDDVFIGSKSNTELSDQKNYEIDKRVQSILEKRYARVKDMLERNKGLFLAIVDKLCDKETLTKNDIEGIIKNYKK
jgi:ATP-dependent metalloprotease